VQWLKRALALPGESSIRRRCLIHLSYVAFYTGLEDEAIEFFKEVLESWVQLGRVFCEGCLQVKSEEAPMLTCSGCSVARYTHRHTHTHTHTSHTHTPRTQHTHTHSHTHIIAHTHTLTRTHAKTWACTHTRTHTHTHRTAVSWAFWILESYICIHLGDIHDVVNVIYSRRHEQ